MNEENNKTMEIIDQTVTMPMLALRGLSVFPNMLLNFDVERPMSVAALNEASNGERKIFLLAQKDITKESPEAHDLYKTGTICSVRQLLRIPGGGIKVLVEGSQRAGVVRIEKKENMFTATVAPVEEKRVKKVTTRVEALIRKAVGLFDAYASITGNVTKEAVIAIYASNEPGYIADYITQNMYLKPDKKQLILETSAPLKRLELVCDMLMHEIEVIEIEQQLDERLRGRLEHQQREHVLREQLRIIQSELGDSSDSLSEYEEYRSRIFALKLDKEIEKKLLKEVDRLEKQPFGSSESSVLRNYLDTCLELPWNKTSKERLDVIAARKILDSDHFGLEKIKDRIIEFLSVRELNEKNNGTILCLVGPPGVGKTSVAISIAKALNRKLARMALGGVHDEAEIRGHRKTYVGAMPGRIISAMMQAGTKNPLLLLDEIDKLGSDYRGDLLRRCWRRSTRSKTPPSVIIIWKYRST